MIPRPNYQRYDIPLTTAGSQDIPTQFTYLRLVSATDINGNQALGTIINVQLGRGLSDKVPMQLNGLVKIPGGIDFARISWAAQANITATLIVSDQDNDSGIQVEAPPAKQLVTSGAGVTFMTSRVTVGAATTVIDPGTTTTQSRTIKNLDPIETIDLGNLAVASGAGFPLAPGETATLSGQNAPIYGIAPSGKSAIVALIVEQ